MMATSAGFDPTAISLTALPSRPDFLVTMPDTLISAVPVFTSVFSHSSELFLRWKKCANKEEKTGGWTLDWKRLKYKNWET